MTQSEKKSIQDSKYITDGVLNVTFFSSGIIPFNTFKEIYNGKEDDITPSVIKDMVDQIQELKKRFTGLLNLSDNEPQLAMVVVEGDTCSVSEFFSRARRKLLKKKDQVQDLKRHQENLQKTFLQETFKIFPKDKIMPLENHLVFYPWSNRYHSSNVNHR